jgi:Ca2+-binding EF-hand superfamily protein
LAFDKDRNGKIGADELEELLKDAHVGNGFTRGAWVSGIIKKMDGSHDGEIDWREFSATLEK